MRPLNESDFPRAAQLLNEGFPHRSVDFWMGALQRMQRYAGNAEAGIPLGWFMTQGDEPVGVLLTLASLRRRPDGSDDRIVNLSSWYVRAPHRWRAGLMLRRLLADESVVYTDLTPNPAVRRMLPMLGFTPLNQGVALHLLPLLCLHPGHGGVVRALTPDEAWVHEGPPREMVEAHRELGCMPLVLESPQGRHLVICKRSRVRGLPAAQLIYAQSQSLLLRHRGALARHLMRQGILLFAHDTRHAASTRTASFRPRDLWFARGHGFDDCTDAFASELCIVHLDRAEAGRANRPLGRTGAAF